MQKQRVAEDQAARQSARRSAADAKLDAMRRAANQATASAAQLGVRPEGAAVDQQRQSRERADLVAQQDRELAQVTHSRAVAVPLAFFQAGWPILQPSCRLSPSTIVTYWRTIVNASWLDRECCRNDTLSF